MRQKWRITLLKRVNHLYEKLISDKNIKSAIEEVNRTHRWNPRHKPNKTVAWVEATEAERINELRQIIEDGFEPSPMAVKQRWDKSAGKYRTIYEPRLYPDQYIHHILVQTLQPIMMRGMAKNICGSIRGRGIHYGVRKIRKWMKEDLKGTKYCIELDIRHFYDTLPPEMVMKRFRCLIKDARVLDLIWRIIKDGVTIGAFTSQWLANTTLQPLDALILSGNYRVSHYIRYMDNFTIFGPNKKELRRLKDNVETWLNGHGMELKSNWQIFPTSARMPTALGYRYGHGYVILRKRNLFRIKRQMNSFRRKRQRNKKIPYSMAFGLLSRIGQLKHCNAMHLYHRYVGAVTQRILKDVVREYFAKERKKWTTSTEQTGIPKSSKQSENSTLIIPAFSPA